MYLNVFLLPVLCVSPPGAVNVLLTTPMWVVNTRLKLQGAKFRNEDLKQTHYRGIFGVCYSLLSLFSTNKMWLTIIIQCVFDYRCFLADHSQRGSGDSLERYTAFSVAGLQPCSRVHVLWSHEEESRPRREEGEGRRGGSQLSHLCGVSECQSCWKFLSLCFVFVCS